MERSGTLLGVTQGEEVIPTPELALNHRVVQSHPLCELCSSRVATTLFGVSSGLRVVFSAQETKLELEIFLPGLREKRKT